MHYEGPREQDDPANEGARPTAVTLLVEDIAHEQRAEDLGRPVHGAVQRAGADIEQRAVVLVEFLKKNQSASVPSFATKKQVTVRQV